MKHQAFFISILLLLFLSTLCQVCPSSHFFNGQRCAPCNANCQCSQQNTCTSCLSGYTYDALFQNCLQCPTASDAVNIGCKQCCYQVKGPGFVCSECMAATYVFQVGGQCLKIAGCLSLSIQGSCNSCASGYFLSQGICSTCDVSCATCHDSSLCLTCKQGYFNGTDISFAHCQACATGCKTCTSTGSTCTNCFQGYRLNSGSCVACGSNCLTCTASACTSCDSLSGLVGTTCPLCNGALSSGSTGCLACTTDGTRLYCSKCDNGYFLNPTTRRCQACTTLNANAVLCNSTTILQCRDDSHATLTSRFYLKSNLCISNTNRCKDMADSTGKCSSCYFVPGAYYSLSNTGVCNLCNVAGCLTYSSTCVCLSCQDGYQFINNQCNACQNLHCYNCKTSTSTCQACAPSYGRLSSACVLCSPSNCFNCDGDNTVCATCNTGYYLNGGKCYTCQANCVSCLSNTQCTVCVGTHYLQANGRCKQLPSNCISIDTNSLASQVGSCKRCNYGYILLEGNCYPCSNSLFNLPLCNNNHCPNYYAQLTHQRFIVLASLLLLLIFLGF